MTFWDFLTGRGAAPPAASDPPAALAPTAALPYRVGGGAWTLASQPPEAGAPWSPRGRYDARADAEAALAAAPTAPGTAWCLRLDGEVAWVGVADATGRAVAAPALPPGAPAGALDWVAAWEGDGADAAWMLVQASGVERGPAVLAAADCARDALALPPIAEAAVRARDALRVAEAAARDGASGAMVWAARVVAESAAASTDGHALAAAARASEAAAAAARDARWHADDAVRRARTGTLGAEEAVRGALRAGDSAAHAARAAEALADARARAGVRDGAALLLALSRVEAETGEAAAAARDAGAFGQAVLGAEFSARAVRAAWALRCALEAAAEVLRAADAPDAPA